MASKWFWEAGSMKKILGKKKNYVLRWGLQPKMPLFCQTTMNVDEFIVSNAWRILTCYWDFNTLIKWLCSGCCLFWHITLSKHVNSVLLVCIRTVLMYINSHGSSCPLASTVPTLIATSSIQSARQTTHNYQVLIFIIEFPFFFLEIQVIQLIIIVPITIIIQYIHKNITIII